jgi:sugar lactone lactonase YvrE
MRRGRAQVHVDLYVPAPVGLQAGPVHELAQPEGGHTDVRMNDGACDPRGAQDPLG